METAVMVQDLRTLVECESPSGDVAATTRCAEVVAELGERWLGAPPQVLRTGERVALLWSWEGPQRRLVLGHLDTVWPMGTLARWPFTHDAQRASGPGCFDMKAGIVQAMHAIASLEDPSGLALLLTSDEEIGAPDSRSLIEQVAQGMSAVYVPEASAAGALKVERKGVSLYAVQVAGRAAHAGLEPELGVNASIELAHQVLAVAGLQDLSAGTTVTPTVLSAGTTTNTVPAAGQIRVDVRARTEAEQDRVDAAMRALRPVLDGASLTIEGGKNRPPLERRRSEALLARAVHAYRELGFGELGAVAVGGASDGNFTAGLGIATLDGLGAVGDGAHAEGEWVSVPDLPRRARLLAALVRPDEAAR
ncbi:M20 family metallopeptidase [Ornithinimicrobium pratense]|uniref:M20 family metallopeptidase n=1 Tax=Ornithinimicrobium pratense TaxID=2593973 RepID=A0A5J6V5Z6_9MICO|nr:M20 family metallopeptidase [Ornithinimicrobium pratense]QFG68452.1 M20 family metallopeptidase [Ornithinimicrobium pratense]